MMNAPPNPTPPEPGHVTAPAPEVTSADSVPASSVLRANGLVQWLLLLIVVVVVVGVRWRLRDLPLERDEGEYAYGAQLLQSGGLIYRDLYSMKWPGIYAAYATMFSVFGESRTGIHLGLLVLNLSSAIPIYLIAREALERPFALFAAATSLVITVLPATHGIIANAEHFALAPALWGWWLLAAGSRTRDLLTVFLAGFLLGLGPVMKQHAITFVALGGVLLLLTPAPFPRGRWRTLLPLCTAYAAGVAGAWAGMLAAIWHQGNWADFYLWTIAYSRNYTGQIPIAWAWTFFSYNFAPILAVIWPVCLLAAAGLMALLRQADWGNSRWPLGCLIAGALATIPGFYFRTHYFLFLMPGLSLLAAFGLRALHRWLHSSRLRQLCVTALTAAITLAFPLVMEGNLLFRKSVDDVSRAMYWPNPFVESPVIARYLQEHVAPEEKIAIFGSEPQICFESRRKLAGGFVYMYPMMELHPLARPMQEQMIREITDIAPEYAVLVAMHLSWMGRDGSDLTMPNWMNGYLKDHYDLCGLIRILSPNQTDYLFAEPGETIDLRQYPLPEGSNNVLIYRRRHP